MDRQLTPQTMYKLQEDLRALDNLFVDVEGKKLRPSQCYRFETDPAHIMFNTNCPDSLRTRVEAILAKYTDVNESGS